MWNLLISFLKSLAFIQLLSSVSASRSSQFPSCLSHCLHSHIHCQHSHILSFFLIVPCIHFIRWTAVRKSSAQHIWREQCCGLNPLGQWMYTELPYCPWGVRTSSPTMAHLKHCCLKWSLKGLFTGMYSYEVIFLRMATMSVSVHSLN